MLAVKLFDADLSSPTFVEDLSTRQSNLQFSTILHGGFGQCSFDIVCNMGEWWEWRLKRYFYRLVIDDGGDTIWEGRLEDIKFVGFGVHLTFFGYWLNLTDQIYNDTTSWQAGTHYADEIIKDMLTDKCPQISSDQSNIQSPALNLTPQTFDDDEYPQALVKRLAEFSDSSKRAWFFAIWDDRVPYFAPKAPSAVDWLVWMRDIESIRLRASTRDLYNDVYAVYLSGGTKTRTASATDSVSQTKYITRQRAITGLGEISASAAQARRDMEMEERKGIQQETEQFILGTRVYDSNGVDYGLWRVRAGDTIRIADLVPATADLDSITLDALRTFYIRETRYDAVRNKLAIVPDQQSQRLEAIIARMV